MRRTLLLSLLCAVIASSLFAGAKITIQNNDPAGSGFNDPTPAAPVGANPGTTIGQQRMYAFQEAAAIWGSSIESPVEIVVAAKWEALPCSETGATLGSAGPTFLYANFANAPKTGVSYANALANALAGRDLSDGPEISARFNSVLGTPTCTNFKWYYGLDSNHGDSIDLVATLLHEFGHGLGFSGATKTSDGSLVGSRPTPFETFTVDADTGLRWSDMTDAQRLASMTNSTKLLWAGPAVKPAATGKMGRYSGLTVLSPASVAGTYDVGTAVFGARLQDVSLNGTVVQARDAADTTGPLETDGCSAWSNASQVAGKIALVDRGSCTFVQKALNAEAAGAIGLIVVENDRTTCTAAPLGGDLLTAVRIPAIRVTSALGDKIKAELTNGVSAILGVNTAYRAGLSSEGYLRLYAPCTVEPGSSIYHWDVVADPNLLMEPNISSDLTHGVDLTVNQLVDMGWTRAVNPGRKILKRK